jgi:cobalt-zinc-cadmium efflux system protein
MHKKRDDIGNLRTAFFLNLAFTIVEIVGGIMTNSLAIMSDALHDFGDSLSLGLAWYFQKLSHKKRDDQFTYGYQRFSLLGALITGIFLVVGGVVIIWRAVERFGAPEETHAVGMMGLAVLGILVNGYAVIRLRRGTSLTERVVSVHLLEDVLGWGAVLVGSVVIYFTGWYQIDAILSLLIAAYILVNAFKNLRSAFRIILQAIPENVNIEKLIETIEGLETVISYHDLHVWSLDGERNILTCHVVVSTSLSDAERSHLRADVKTRLKALNIHHCTIELELPNEHDETDYVIE